MSEYTQEPWYDDKRGHGVITDVLRRTIATANRPEDSRRIVACVNACAGIPTAEIERKGIPLYMYERLIQQRDKLMEAMKEICMLDNSDGMIHARCIANAIIAKVEARK